MSDRPPAPGSRLPEERSDDFAQVGSREPAAGYKAPRWAWWVATGFGSGYLKPAPGTWGSLAAIPFWILYFKSCRLLFGLTHGPLGIRLLLWELPIATGLLAFLALSVRASELVEKASGRTDPGFIVIDEWMGMGLALWAFRDALSFWPIPTHLSDGRMTPWSSLNVLMVLLPFLFFRIVDIWKPWPCKRLQELHGGLGIVLDDVAAGLWVMTILVLAKVFSA